MFFELIAAIPIASGFVSRMAALIVLGGLIGMFLALLEIFLGDAWLRVQIGKQEGTDFVISRNPTIVGRDDRCAIVLTGDPGIAHEHLSITKVGDEYRMRHAQGNERFVVNGAACLERTLQPGDRIQLSQTVLIFKRKGRTEPARTQVAPAAIPALAQCPACGSPVRPGAKFCPTCRQRLM